MEIQGLARLFIGVGVAFLALGVVLMVAGNVPFLGRLPGDLVFRKGNLTIFAPLVTMVLISLIKTIALNVFARLFR